MKLLLSGAAVALASLVLTAPALADDPNDPAMRSAAARARDRAIIRQMNLNELERVRARDAQYQQGWDAYREARSGRDPRRADYDRQMAEYRAARARHDREMARWREAVRRCEAGDWSYCDN